MPEQSEPRSIEAERATAVAREEYIRRVVDDAAPLTAEQRDRLAGMLSAPRRYAGGGGRVA